MGHSKNQSILQILTTVKPVLQKLISILILADLTFIKFLIDSVFNVVKGNVCVSNKNVTSKRFRHVIETICQKKVNVSEKRRHLATNQGVALVKTIAQTSCFIRQEWNEETNRD